MIGRSSILTLVLISVMGSALFRVKYQVMGLERRHKQVKHSIQETQEAYHVLRAEWAHLNDPKRLQQLAQKYLPQLKPIKGVQMVSLDHVMAHTNGYDKNALEELIRQAANESANHKDAD